MISFDNLIAIHKMLWPDTNLEQQRAKYEEEKKEYNNTRSNTEDELYELADMIVVSAGIARFDYTEGIGLLANVIFTSGYGIDDVWHAVEKKMLRNMRRNWTKKDDVGYHHTNGIED